MKKLKIVAFAALAIFLIACDNASETMPTSDGAEAVGATQSTLEDQVAPRGQSLYLDSITAAPVG